MVKRPGKALDKTALVTGGAGFIGSHVVDKLLENKWRVVVVDDFNDYYDPDKKRENVFRHLKKSEFVLVQEDIRNFELLRSVFAKYPISLVIHLAARAGVRASFENPRLYYEVNFMGTLNLLELMREYSVSRLLFASSSSVYGERSIDAFNEIDKTDEQVSPYASSKKAAEVLLRSYASAYGLNTTVLRFFTAYGPRNRPDMACYKFMKAISNGSELIQYGDGYTGRDYTYVEDVAEAVLKATEKKFKFEIFNIGNSKPVKLKKLIAEIEKRVKKTAKINVMPLPEGDVHHTYADVSKAKKMLGWSPTTTLKVGLKNLYEWYK